MPGSYIGCVYLATNTANGTIYIGKSKLGLAFRRRTHEKSREPVGFPAAIRKYGKEAFDWNVLYSSDDDRALMAAEVALIADYRATGIRMYNITDGGDGCAGRKMSPSQLVGMRKPRSEETKAKMRASNTPEVQAARRAARLGKTLSQEARTKISAAQKGRKKSPEHIAKIVATRALTVRMPPWTPERRAKMEAATLARQSSRLERKTAQEVRDRLYREIRRMP